MIHRALAFAPLLLVACGGAATTRPAGSPKPPAASKSTTTQASVSVTPEQRADRAEKKLLQNLAQQSSPSTPEIFTFSKSRRDGSVQRTQVEPISFRVGDLPLATLPEQLSAATAPSGLPSGNDPSELYLDWRGTDPIKARGTWTTVRISLKDATLGRIRIGSNEAPVAAGAAGGVYVTCGGEVTNSRPMISPARWETLTAGASGAARYTVVDGWFDARTCKAVEVRRTSVEARSLAGGLLYGFREACPSPASVSPHTPTIVPPSASAATTSSSACSGEALTLLGPRLQHVVATGVGGDAKTMLGSFSRVTLPLRRGGGGSLVERIAASSLREWCDASGSRASFSRDVLLGVEVVQAVDDPEPIAVSYVSEGS